LDRDPWNKTKLFNINIIGFRKMITIDDFYIPFEEREMFIDDFIAEKVTKKLQNDRNPKNWHVKKIHSVYWEFTYELFFPTPSFILKNGKQRSGLLFTLAPLIYFLTFGNFQKKNNIIYFPNAVFRIHHPIGDGISLQLMHSQIYKSQIAESIFLPNEDLDLIMNSKELFISTKEEVNEQRKKYPKPLLIDTRYITEVKSNEYVFFDMYRDKNYPLDIEWLKYTKPFYATSIITYLQWSYAKEFETKKKENKEFRDLINKEMEEESDGEMDEEEKKEIDERNEEIMKETERREEERERKKEKEKKEEEDHEEEILSKERELGHDSAEVKFISPEDQWKIKPPFDEESFEQEELNFIPLKRAEKGTKQIKEEEEEEIKEIKEEEEEEERPKDIEEEIKETKEKYEEYLRLEEEKREIEEEESIEENIETRGEEELLQEAYELMEDDKETRDDFITIMRVLSTKTIRSINPDVVRMILARAYIRSGTNQKKEREEEKERIGKSILVTLGMKRGLLRLWNKIMKSITEEYKDIIPAELNTQKKIIEELFSIIDFILKEKKMAISMPRKLLVEKMKEQKKN